MCAYSTMCDILKHQQRTDLQAWRALSWIRRNKRISAEEKRRRGRRGQVWFPLSFLYRPLRRSRGGNVEKKEGITEKYRREQQDRSCVLNLNPKPTGRLKPKRLGSSVASLWKYCMSVNYALIWLLVALPAVKCFLSLASFKVLLPGLYLGFLWNKCAFNCTKSTETNITPTLQYDVL